MERIPQDTVNDLYALLHAWTESQDEDSDAAALDAVSRFVGSRLAEDAFPLLIADPRSEDDAPYGYAVQYADGVIDIAYGPIYQAQMDCLDAIRESQDMSPEQKASWEAIAAEEAKQ